MQFPELVWATPRKLPKASSLRGSVVVLDIAFASNAGGASFEGITLPFIRSLGERLKAWVDHHDHEMHAHYKTDARFVLATKAEHGACPEMVTPALFERIGPVETLCAHNDFDGICAAAKWIREGVEPYEGADDDAWAIDTRMKAPSMRAAVLDRALRAAPRDMSLRGLMVRFLVDGANDTGLWRRFEEVAAPFVEIERHTQQLAQDFRVFGEVAVLKVQSARHYDKTLLLLLGQERARISLICDEQSINIAARFDSGVNLLEILGLSGGMPTRVGVSRSELTNVLGALAISHAIDYLG